LAETQRELDEWHLTHQVAPPDRWCQHA